MFGFSSAPITFFPHNTQCECLKSALDHYCEINIPDIMSISLLPALSPETLVTKN